MNKKRAKTVEKLSLRDSNKISLLQELQKLKKCKESEGSLHNASILKQHSVDDKIIGFATSMPSGDPCEAPFRIYNTYHQPPPEQKLYILNKFLLKNSNKNVSKLVKIFKKLQKQKSQKPQTEFVPTSISFINALKNIKVANEKTTFVGRIKIAKTKPRKIGPLTRNEARFNLRPKNRSSQRKRVNLSACKNYYNSSRSSRKSFNIGNALTSSQKNMSFNTYFYNSESASHFKNKILNANSKKEFRRLSSYLENNRYASPEQFSDYQSYR
ncbi:unnamed protein product [Moneuplotes crassus]|uniref:Uncharacterized protein n=1 Tax=Euplotes crassus TaxID=5936 RepID=A0AAD1XJ61_EUPCR|nr:unnamed protein product [Moneuplotes crassus]